MGSRPTASELSTSAGRVFLISAPIVGSKLTSQISPRRGVRGLVFDNVATLPLFATGLFVFHFVKLGSFLRLPRKYSPSLLHRKLHEGSAVRESQWFSLLQLVFLGNHESSLRQLPAALKANEQDNLSVLVSRCRHCSSHILSNREVVV